MTDGGMAGLEAAEAAAERQDTKVTSHKLASILAGAVKEGEATGAEETAGTNLEDEVQGGEETGGAEGENVEGASGTDETAGVEEVTQEDLTEAEKVLQELGVDMGVTLADVPEELRPSYERLLYSAIDMAEKALRSELEASDVRRQHDDFKSVLEKSPDRLLMALAVANPDLVAKAGQLVESMNSDPAVKEQVLRELDVESRRLETERRMRLLDERELRLKAAQVEAAARRAARLHGVDYGVVDNVVSMAIRANGGNLDPADVDEIVQNLKTTAPRQKPKKVVTPAAAAAARGAPSGSVAGAGSTPTAPDQSRKLSKGLVEGERKQGGGVFRNIIRDAARRIATQERG